MSYTVHTSKSWAATNVELQNEFSKWGVTDWDTNYPRGARLEGYNQSEIDRTVTLRYSKNGKEVSLTMSKQDRAIDNLRVLYLVIESMRMNEKRGISEVIESAYLQLAGPAQEKSPYEVLNVFPGSPLQVCEAAYKFLAVANHPDKGGDPKKMTEINGAIEKIRKGIV